MAQVHEGGCSCGAVRYRVRSTPLRTSVCHCGFCQRRTGSAFGIGAYFNPDDVEIVRGELRSYEYRSDESGRWLRTQFCPSCGTTFVPEQLLPSKADHGVSKPRVVAEPVAPAPEPEVEADTVDEPGGAALVRVAPALAAVPRAEARHETVYYDTADGLLRRADDDGRPQVPREPDHRDGGPHPGRARLKDWIF